MKFGIHYRPSRAVIRKLIDTFFGTSWEVLADNNDDIDLENLGYQQDDASSPVTRTKYRCKVHKKFPVHVFCHFGGQHFLPSSCDLTSINESLLGH